MIQIFTTGGTIDGLDYIGDTSAIISNQSIIPVLLTRANLSIEYSVETIYNKDSRNITEEDLEFLHKKIKFSSSAEIVVTHGTVTMVKTAHFLASQNIDKTIVLVGSFVLGSDGESDAEFNLGFAIGILSTLKKGVYIAMNGKVFSHKSVFKNIEKNRFELL
ncbi:MAG: asparaginase domain-containing protein [Maribacter sp.]